MPVTLEAWLGQAAARLREAGVEAPRLEAQVLAAAVMGQPRSWVIAHPETDAPEGLEPILARRLDHEPLAYILGWREFYGRRFEVGPDVLVPRQETEVVLEAALSVFQSGTVLDVGTGSGCLGVSLALERPDADVLCIDISEPALVVAARNAEALGAKVRFLASDLFAALPKTQQFDLIVSNPPYISRDEELPREIADWEPEAALYGGSDGMKFYDQLAREGRTRLNRGGVLVVEIGDGMAGAVKWSFEAEDWTVQAIKEDLSGTPRAAILRPPVAS